MSMSVGPEDAALNYQLEMLKVEIETINSTIRQMDDISKSLKEWTVTIWAASVGGALATNGLSRYVWATSAIPILFWIVDSYHHVVQRRFIWRGLEVMDFLNDERLTESFRQKRIVGFAVFDVGARRFRDPRFYKFTAWWRVALFRTISVLYLGLTLLSWAVWCMI
ncbi:MAG TPA: hypothetical protein VF618_23320 [Thermoanaerobaculia bacterium]